MKKLFPLLTFLPLTTSTMAQSVGVGTPGPAASAQLDITSTTKGLLIPRMDKGQRSGIISPANGLLVFQNSPDSIGFYYYFSGSWTWLQTANAGWSRTGNGGTIDGVNNFIGTTDAKPVRFIENGYHAGLIDGARGSYFFGGLAGYLSLPGTSGNSAFGNLSMLNNLTGSSNTAMGSHSLYENKTGSRNTVVGVLALHKDTAANETVAVGAEALYWNQARSGNTGIGTKALYNNANTDKGVISITGGMHNTAMGYSAMFNNRKGYDNVAVGYEAAFNNTGPFGIVAIGNKALHRDEYGYYSIAIGNEAASKAHRGRGTIAIGYHAFDSTASNIRTGTVNWDNIAIGTGSMALHNVNTENVAVGYATLSSNVNGNSNVAVGAQALQLQSSGSTNVAIGAHALLGNTTGDGNVALGFGSFNSLGVGSNNVGIGYNAGYFETTSNKLYIENSNANKDNALIYGDFAADSLLLNADVTIRDFTRLGSRAEAAPAIKMKELFATSSSTSTGQTGVNYGLTDSKIISVSTLLEWTTGYFAPPEYSPDPLLRYNYFITPTQIVIQNNAASCAYICSKPAKILITYKE